MSRHHVMHRGYCIAFGWDFPLNSFFAQVEDINADADNWLLDMGGLDCPYTDVTAFQQAFEQRLRELGIDDFVLSQQQLFQLLAEQDGVAINYL